MDNFFENAVKNSANIQNTNNTSSTFNIYQNKRKQAEAVSGPLHFVENFDFYNEKDIQKSYALSQKESEYIDSIYKSFYSNADIDPREEKSKIMLSNMLAREFPELGYDYFYNNFELFMETATGYDLTPTNYAEHLGNVFKSSSLSYLNSIDAFFTTVFNPQGIEDMLTRTQKRAASYRQDIGDRKYSSIFARSLTEAVAQAPNLIASAGEIALSSIPGIPSWLLTATRIATSGMIEGGSVMLDLVSNGANPSTAVATGLSVLVLNGTAEVYGDNLVLAPFQRFIKNNKQSREFVTDYFKDFAKTTGMDLLKAMPAEIGTEMLQETVSMTAYNFAVDFEHKFGRMEDVTGYSKEDFANALSEVAVKTALGTPMIVLGQDFLAGGANFIGGDWRKSIKASDVTKRTDNSQVFKTEDINFNQSVNKYLSKKEIKNDKPDAIKLVQIGDKLFARDTNDAQVSALKSSAYVNAFIDDFSIDPSLISEHVDMEIDYDTAIDALQKAYKKNLLDGYSLLDSNLQQTRSVADAKYIAIDSTNAKGNPIAITLGENKDIENEFEEVVFGETFTPKKELQKTNQDEVDEGISRFSDYLENIEEDENDDDIEDVDYETSIPETNETEEKVEQDDVELPVEEQIQIKEEEKTTVNTNENKDENTEIKETQEIEPSTTATVEQEKDIPEKTEAPTKISNDDTKTTPKIKREEIIKEAQNKEAEKIETIEKATVAEKTETAKEVAQEIAKVDPDNAVEKSVIVSTVSKLADKPEVELADKIAEKPITDDPRFNLLTEVINALNDSKNSNREKLRTAYNTKSLNSKVKKQINNDLEVFKSTGIAPKGLEDFFSILNKASSAIEEHKETVKETQNETEKVNDLINSVNEPVNNSTQTEQEESNTTNIRVIKKKDLNKETSDEKTDITQEKENDKKVIKLKKKEIKIKVKNLVEIKKDEYNSLSKEAKNVVDESIDKSETIQEKIDSIKEEMKDTPKTDENIDVLTDKIVDIANLEKEIKEEQDTVVQTIKFEETQGKDSAIEAIEEVKEEIQEYNKTEENEKVVERNNETIKEIEEAKEESLNRNPEIKDIIKDIFDKEWIRLKSFDPSIYKKTINAKILSVLDISEKNEWKRVSDRIDRYHHLSVFRRMMKSYDKIGFDKIFGQFALQSFDSMLDIKKRLEDIDNFTEEQLKHDLPRYEDLRYSLYTIYSNEDILSDNSISIEKKMELIKEWDKNKSSLSFTATEIKNINNTLGTILDVYVKPELDRQKERYENGKSIAIGLGFDKAEELLSSNKINPFYEPYVYVDNYQFKINPDSLYRFLQTRFGNNIKAKVVTKLISAIDSKSMDIILKNNGGRLFMDVSEASIDIGDARGASILESSQIILSDKSDTSTVIHEVFHILKYINGEFSSKIDSSIKEILENDLDSLKSFMKDNPLFDDIESDINDLRLGESKNAEDLERYDEVLARLYEAWFLGGESKAIAKKDTVITTIFKQISDIFKDIYNAITGRDYLPESLDEAFSLTFRDVGTKKDSTSKEVSNEKQNIRYQSAKSINSKIENDLTRKDALDTVSNILFYKVSDDISDIISNSTSVDDAIKRILDNKSVSKYISKLSKQSQKYVTDVIKERVKYISSSPSAYARKFGNDIKKLSDSLGSVNSKATAEAAKVVLDQITELWNSVRTKAKNSTKVLETDIVPLFSKENFKKRIYNTEKKTTETVSYKASDVMYKITESMKRTGKLTESFTPSEILNLAKQLVDTNGNIVVGDSFMSDGSYKSPFAMMYYYKISNSKDKITGKVPSSFLDKNYVDTSNLLIRVLQKPNTKGFDIESNMFKLSDMLDDLDIQDSWIESIANNETDMSISIGIGEALTDKINDIRSQLNKITGKDVSNSPVKALLESVSALQQKAYSLNRKEKNLKDVDELKNEVSSLNSQIKKLNKENEKLNIKISELSEKPDDIQIELKRVKSQLAYANSQLKKLKEGANPEADKLKKQLDSILNSEAYIAFKQIEEKLKGNIDLLLESLGQGDAYIANDLTEIFKTLQKRGFKDHNKLNIFPYERYINNEIYYPIFAFMEKNGMIDKFTENGKEYWNIIRTVYDLKPSEMKELSSLFRNVRNYSMALLKNREAEKEDRFRTKQDIILNSLANLNGFDTTWDLQSYIREYFKKYHPGSIKETEHNKKTLREKFGESQFTLITYAVKQQSPALYAYMFGGDMNGEYNSNNLNTATDNEVLNINKRTSSFIKEISSLFGIDEKNVNYSIKDIFKKNTSTIKGMRIDDLLNKYHVSREKDIGGLLLNDDTDARLIALAQYEYRISKKLTKAEKKVESLKKKLEDTLNEYDKKEIEESLLYAEVQVYTYNKILYDTESIDDEYTMDAMMAIYIQAQSLDGLSSMLTNYETDSVTNNLSLSNIAYVMDKFISDPEYDKYRQLADFMMEDVGSRYEAIRDVYYEAENKLLKKEDMYFPIKHLKEIENQGNVMSYGAFFEGKGYVSDRFTNDRTGSRYAIDFDVIDTYLNAIKKQEHYIAFKLLTDEYSKMFNKNGDLAKAFMALNKDKQGKAEQIITQLYDYNEAIKGHTNIPNDLNSLVAKIRNNFVVAKLWGNIATILQQFPTYLLVANKIGWKKATEGLVEFMRMGKDRSQFVYNLSPQMRYRAKIETDVYKSYRNNSVSKLEKWADDKFNVDLDKGIQSYRKVIDWGMGLIEKADRNVSNAMWYSIYKAKLEELSHSNLFETNDELQQAAATDATQTVMDLIPSSNVKDNALAYSNRDNAVKELLLFTNQLNKQFNILYGDIVDFSKKNWKQKLGDFILHDLILIGAVSAVASILSGTPFPDDNDDDKWKAFWTELGWYTLGESTGMIPIIGSSLKSVITGTTYSDTNIIEQINRLRNTLSKPAGERTDHQLLNATMGVVSEAGTLFGFPSNAIMKSYKAILNLADDASIGDVGYLVNTRTGDFYTSLTE